MKPDLPEMGESTGGVVRAGDSPMLPSVGSSEPQVWRRVVPRQCVEAWGLVRVSVPASGCGANHKMLGCVAPWPRPPRLRAPALSGDRRFHWDPVVTASGLKLVVVGEDRGDLTGGVQAASRREVDRGKRTHLDRIYERGVSK